MIGYGTAPPSMCILWQCQPLFGSATRSSPNIVINLIDVPSYSSLNQKSLAGASEKGKDHLPDFRDSG